MFRRRKILTFAVSDHTKPRFRHFKPHASFLFVSRGVSHSTTLCGVGTVLIRLTYVWHSLHLGNVEPEQFVPSREVMSSAPFRHCTRHDAASSSFSAKRGIAPIIHGDILLQKRHLLYRPRADRAPPSPALTIAARGH